MGYRRRLKEKKKKKKARKRHGAGGRRVTKWERKRGELEERGHLKRGRSCAAA